MARIRSIHPSEIPGSQTLGTRYLYIICEVGSSQPVKVGRAANPVWRVNDLQSGNYRRLELRSIWVGARDDIHALESEIHQRLAACGVGGEWFAVDAVQASEIVEDILAAH